MSDQANDQDEPDKDMAMSGTPGIQALMRLNARLHKRIDILNTALEFVAGPKSSPCGGAMVTDESGNAFSAEIQKWLRETHAKTCMRCFSRRVLDDCNDLSAADPADRYHVITEVLARCDAQDQQWGGPEHDDTHKPHHWLDFMRKFLNRIIDANTYSEYEDNMLHVAALAVQAIQSTRRRKRAQPQLIGPRSANSVVDDVDPRITEDRNT